MTNYVQNNLTASEEIAYQAKTSIWSYLVNFFFAIIIMGLGVAAVLIDEITTIGPILIAFSLLILISVALRYINTELAVTNKRVIAKFGVIRRRTVELKLARIESIQVDQGLIGRMFGYGSIVVAGAGTPQSPIPNISNPLAFRNAVVEIQEANAS